MSLLRLDPMPWITAYYPNGKDDLETRTRAAAPELLAALESIVTLCDRDSEIGEIARAAIAKALGE